jgi:hypothetical protein
VICYRDRTYCSASMSGKCINRECDRYVTHEIIEDSIQSWPLALSDLSKKCGKVIAPPRNAGALGR